MYANDNSNTTINATRPATLAELAALDATREVPYLKAICNRIRIHLPNPNPPPAEIIPHIETRLAEHNKRGRNFLSDRSGDYFEWKAIKEDLEEFISYLRQLLASPKIHNPVNPVPDPSLSSFPSVNPSTAASPPQNPPSEAGQYRDKSGTRAGQGRDNPGTDPGQKRDNPGQPSQNSEKTSENPQTPKTENPNPPGTAGTNNDEPTQPPKPDPDPNSVNLSAYFTAYFEKHGPPPREPLDKKSPELQRYILTLIEDKSLRKAQHELMLPPPYGLYIATSKSALARLRNRHHTREAKRNKRAIKKHITDLLAQPDLPDADVTRVTEQLLKLKLVESGLHPDPDLAQTKTLIDMLEKIHAGKLAERKVALAESKQ